MPAMDKKRVLKFAKSVRPLAIAVIGIWWVDQQDVVERSRLAVLAGQDDAHEKCRAGDRNIATDADLAYQVFDPRTGRTITLPRRSSCE